MEITSGHEGAGYAPATRRSYTAREHGVDPSYIGVAQQRGTGIVLEQLRRAHQADRGFIARVKARVYGKPLARRSDPTA